MMPAIRLLQADNRCLDWKQLSGDACRMHGGVNSKVPRLGSNLIGFNLLLLRQKWWVDRLFAAEGKSAIYTKKTHVRTGAGTRQRHNRLLGIDQQTFRMGQECSLNATTAAAATFPIFTGEEWCVATHTH